MSIGGQAGTQVAFLLDGQDNNSQQISTGHSGQKEIIKPSVDAIQEFKVVTNGYAAEYGRSSSGVVSVSLKSGTNQVHGSGFEFFRDDAFDAGITSRRESPYNRHQFGGAVGFPVVRNRTFFFGNFETGRHPAIRHDRLHAAAGQRSRGSVLEDHHRPPDALPFPGNVIPASRIDPVARESLAIFPLRKPTATTNNYVFNSPSNEDGHSWDFRIDQVHQRQSDVLRARQFSADGSCTIVSPAA